MRADVVLIPSPLLGPAVWAPVGERLRARGREVTVVGASRAVADGRPPRAPADEWAPSNVLGRLRADVPTGRPVVLVPHSNAGLYVPGLAQGRDVVGVVFVDAGLPPSDGEVPLAPRALLDHLRRLADDHGVLPPWTQWWDDEALGSLFPDDTAKARVEAEQSRIPLSYFTSALPVAGGWMDVPCGYLAFGDTYAEERERATSLGWPVETLPGGHFHMLHEPERVADAVERVIGRLASA